MSSETNIYVDEAYAALTANGNAGGYVTVGAVDGFYPGGTAYVTSDTVASLKCIITKLDVTNKYIYLRPIPANGAGPQYTYTSLVAYTTATNARVYMEAGIVPLMSPGSIVKKDRVP